jgi:beta-lactamase superfamily II metal-dependent hydrolase
VKQVVVLFLVLAGAFLAASTAAAAGKLTVRFVAVGEGDATVFQGPCSEIGVLDVPRGRAPRVLEALDTLGSRKLRWIMVSHYDADHLGGVVSLATAPDVRVANIYDRGPRGGEVKGLYRTYVDWLKQSDQSHHDVHIGETLSLCEGKAQVTFEVVSVGLNGTAAGGVRVSSENDKGICLKITYILFKMAACGDVNGVKTRGRADVESAVAPEIGRVDLAKVDHHGGRYSSNRTFVDTLAPSAAVISVGKNPLRWGHPNPAVVRRWDAVGDVFQTGTSDGRLFDGDVIATTDGTTSIRIRTTHSGVAEGFPLVARAALPIKETATASATSTILTSSGGSRVSNLVRDLALIGATLLAVALGAAVARWGRGRAVDGVGGGELRANLSQLQRPSLEGGRHFPPSSP